jgi:iron(III) transport system ATP-binding protein
LKDEIKQKVIHKIKEEGNSALFVTHDLEDALSLGDKIIVMKDGEIMQFDTPQMVYEKPANEYVAYLFGNVNIINTIDLIKEFKLDKASILHGKSKKACIRPEHFIITSKEKALTTGTVNHVAYLGDSYELEVKTKNLLIRVNTRKKKINKGDKIYLKLNKSKIHFMGISL